MRRFARTGPARVQRQAGASAARPPQLRLPPFRARALLNAGYTSPLELAAADASRVADANVLLRCAPFHSAGCDEPVANAIASELFGCIWPRWGRYPRPLVGFVSQAVRGLNSVSTELFAGNLTCRFGTFRASCSVRDVSCQPMSGFVRVGSVWSEKRRRSFYPHTRYDIAFIGRNAIERSRPLASPRRESHPPGEQRGHASNSPAAGQQRGHTGVRIGATHVPSPQPSAEKGGSAGAG